MSQADAPQQPLGNTPSEQKTAEGIFKEGEHQRMLGVVPMFGTTNYRNAPPLTSEQKFEQMTRTAIDPFTWFAAGAQAGISQAENEFGEYGQGAAGYGKRYSATYMDSLTAISSATSSNPVLFRQDPRYFRLGQGYTVKQRMGSALKQEFVTRKDSGGHTFHFSNVLGAFTAGGISNAYYPKDDRGFGLTVSRSAIALGYGCLGNVLVEFWPDIDRKLFHRGGGKGSLPMPPAQRRNNQPCETGNRSRLNPARSIADARPNAHAASASPIAAECLNPWPEHAEANTTFSQSRNLSTMNLASGVTV